MTPPPPPHSAPQNWSIPSIAGGIIINKHFHKNSMKWKKVYFSSNNAASKCAHFVFLTSVWFKTNNLWHMSYQRELLWLSAALLHNHNVMCWHTYLFIFKMTFFFWYIYSFCMQCYTTKNSAHQVDCFYFGTFDVSLLFWTFPSVCWWPSLVQAFWEPTNY